MRGLRESFQRFFDVMPPLDAARLFSPLALMTSAFAYAVLHHRPPREVDDLDARDAEYTDAVLDLSRWLARHYFRLEVRGLENVPRDAVLLVGNHNGGVLPLDIFWLLATLYDRDGPELAPHILVHDIIAYHPIGHEFVTKLGFLRATQSSAEAALRAGRRVAVYPGADVEAFRPFWKSDRIDLAGHRGFARTAIRTGVPIVPVVSVGTHEQLVVLSTGTSIAKLLGTQRWLRTRVLPIVWCVPWGLSLGLFLYLPLPAQTTLAFGEPIRWPSLQPKDADDPEIVERCAAQVAAEMQTMLDRLSTRRIALLGKFG